MPAPRVLVLCFNPIDIDARVRREAESLARHGFEVLYLHHAQDRIGRRGRLEPNLAYEAVPYLGRWTPALLERAARRYGIYDDLVAAHPQVFCSDQPFARRLSDAVFTRLAATGPSPFVTAYRRALHLAERAARALFVPAPPPESDSATAGAVVADLQWLLHVGFSLVERGRAFRPDWVLAIDACMLPAATALARLLGARVVYDAHEIFYAQWPDGSRPEAWVRAWRVLEARLLAHTTARFAVSEGVALHLERELHAGPFVPLYNALRLAIPALSRSRSAPHVPLRAELHGVLAPGKGLEGLVDSAAHLTRAVLTLRGPGSEHRRLAARGAALNLGARLKVQPGVPYPRLLAVLADDDLCVLSYPDNCLNNRVSLPNKLFEGLMAGLPLLVPQRPELARLVREHGVGVVLDDESPRGIAAQIDAIASDPAGWRRMHDNALAAARDRFNWELEEPKLLAAFRNR
ncbi:MAG: glycosyltransferase [Deltaproteobacteria bacterium]|nr:glycosyltransferase [Deltaproteobacteria bacterium]